MAEEKYFTPDIEDIHQGFECEYQDNYGYETLNNGKANWIPIKIKLKDEEGAYTSEIEDILIGMDDGCTPIRVAYLTKEQIEAEGWEEVKNEGISCPGVSFLHIPFFKDDMWCYLGKEHTVWLGTNKGTNCLFQGSCKDINTFRLICKLLKT